MMAISVYCFCQKTLCCMVYCRTCVVYYCQNGSKLNHQGNPFTPQLVWCHCLQWNHFPFREMVSRVLRVLMCKFLQVIFTSDPAHLQNKNHVLSLGRRGCHSKSAAGNLQPFGQPLTSFICKRLCQEPVSQAARYEFSQINPGRVITLDINTCTETSFTNWKLKCPLVNLNFLVFQRKAKSYRHFCSFELGRNLLDRKYQKP